MEADQGGKNPNDDPRSTPKQMDGNQVQLLASCSVPNRGNTPVGVTVPSGALTAVPLLHRVQVSPVLVPSASSAFQVAAPLNSSGVSDVPGAAEQVDSKPVIIHQQAVASAGHTVVANSSAEAEASSSPTPVAANTAVTTLPPGPFYFMLPNSAAAGVPTIAPRPQSSEALTSPPVVTNVARGDGSPVAAVPVSPLEVDVSPTGMVPLKRQRSDSPRESKRRAIHNEVERRRRDKINFYMDKLKELVPNPPTGASPNYSKGHVLEKTLNHITDLQNQLSAVQRRYEVERNQLLQCASQHTLLRQQLIDGGLKPAFGLFKIAPIANGTQASGEPKTVELVKVGVQNIIPAPTHNAAFAPPAVATTVTASNAPSTVGQSSSDVLRNVPPLISNRPGSPPALTVVTFPQSTSKGNEPEGHT